MNPSQKDALLLRLTSGPLFSPDRNATKEFLSEIVQKVNFDKNDADLLSTVEIVAPGHGEFQAVLLPHNTPRCILYPSVEMTDNKEAAEEAIAGSLARAIVTIRGGTSPNQIERETKNLLRSWNYQSGKAAAA